jgi:hypothetical protein
MAKAHRRKTSTSVQVIRATPVRAPAPIVIRQSAPRTPKPKKHHRRRHGSGGGLTIQHIVAAGIGGFALGFVKKTFPTLPTVPILGRSGTIALGAYLLRSHVKSPIVRDIALAAAAVAGNELGSTGTISGDVVPQVSGGVAAQV